MSRALDRHFEWHGKIEVISRAKIDTADDLSLAYTPGVAEPCLEIVKDPGLSYDLTRRSNLVAVITNGTAVLGLGDIGPEAGMPVMEGKCSLFKEFAGIDAFPICIKSRDIDEIVNTIYQISGSFGGINLEDFAAPACFEIEKRLNEICDIPVFHDDQHGTAVVVTAALINAMKVTGRSKNMRIVISGAGAAGTAICRRLLSAGFTDITMYDRCGILSRGTPGMTRAQRELAGITNIRGMTGGLADAMKDADAFIGVSAPGIVSEDMVRSMNADPIILSLANPVPEIMPDAAKRAGAAVIGTGRSDMPNQINNVLAFPGIFRGALDCRAKCINDAMKTAASVALASLIPDSELRPDRIMPSALDKKVAPAVAAAVIDAARATGAARI